MGNKSIAQVKELLKQGVPYRKIAKQTGWTPQLPRQPQGAAEVMFGPAYDATHVYAAGSLDFPGRAPWKALSSADWASGSAQGRRRPVLFSKSASRRALARS